MKEISFHGVMLDNLFYADKKWKMELQQIVSKGIRDGAVKPLVRTVFKADELEEAFRYVQDLIIFTDIYKYVSAWRLHAIHF